MSEIYNIYCDESGHLISADQKSMVLGALSVPKSQVPATSDDIKQIKIKYGYNEHLELKWVKVAPSNIGMFIELVDYFICNPYLNFRCTVVPDKSLLKHESFDRSHDDFYYVMFYYALQHILRNDCIYNIYFDYKDVNQNKSLIDMKKFLIRKCSIRDENLKLQIVQSHESQLIQLSDVLIGAVAYKNRGLTTSLAKLQIIDYLSARIGVKLDQTSLMAEQKFNVFRWVAS